MKDLLVTTSVLVLIPLVGLVFASHAGRAAFFLLGLALLGLNFVVHFGGHDPYSIIPYFGACLALAALLAELLVRGVRLVRSRRTQPEEQESP